MVTDAEQLAQISVPILETRPSRSLPPDELCLGVNPRKTANSRGREKAEISWMLAASAEAVTGPMHRLKPDPYEVPERIGQNIGKIVRMADNLHLTANLTRFVDNAYGGLFHRNVQSGKILHAALLSDVCGYFTQTTFIISLKRSTSAHLRQTGRQPNIPSESLAGASTRKRGNPGLFAAASQAPTGAACPGCRPNYPLNLKERGNSTCPAAGLVPTMQSIS